MKTLFLIPAIFGSILAFISLAILAEGSLVSIVAATIFFGLAVSLPFFSFPALAYLISFCRTRVFWAWQLFALLIVSVFPHLPNIQEDGFWIIAWIFLSWMVHILSFVLAIVTSLIIRKKQKLEALPSTEVEIIEGEESKI